MSAIARQLTTVAQAPDQLTITLDEILQNTVRAAAHVGQTSTALTDSTTGAVGEVQFQDIGRQMIEHVVTAVMEVQRQVDQMLTYARGNSASTDLMAQPRDVDHLRETYVMVQQRHGHADGSGNAPSVEVDLPKIELF